MRVCVYGAGAIGGHLAMRFARGGAEVSVVARGPHLAAIQRDGLTVHAVDGEHHVTLPASDDPAAARPAGCRRGHGEGPCPAAGRRRDRALCCAPIPAWPS